MNNNQINHPTIKAGDVVPRKLTRGRSGAALRDGFDRVLLDNGQVIEIDTRTRKVIKVSLPVCPPSLNKTQIKTVSANQNSGRKFTGADAAAPYCREFYAIGLLNDEGELLHTGLRESKREVLAAMRKHHRSNPTARLIHIEYSLA